MSKIHELLEGTNVTPEDRDIIAWRFREFVKSLAEELDRDSPEGDSLEALAELKGRKDTIIDLLEMVIRYL